MATPTMPRKELNVPAEEATHLEAVLADAEADGPRLAYADFLSRRGRPADIGRAEFIRLQIELARLAADSPRSPALIARCRDLLEKYRPTWEKPLRDLLNPGPTSPGRWLRAALFGTGGMWGFRRGFVELIHAPAGRFLAEDVAIVNRAPIRRVVLGHASERVIELAAEPRLNGLESLHLVGDMEMDEDLTVLAAAAREAGLRVFEFRMPRLWPDAEDLFDCMRAGEADEDGPAWESMPAWSAANPAARTRLARLASDPSVALLASEPASEGELLALNEWVYLGETLRSAGAWAVAKGHGDLEDDDGHCRRLALARPGEGDKLPTLPYFHGELGGGEADTVV